MRLRPGIRSPAAFRSGRHNYLQAGLPAVGNSRNVILAAGRIVLPACSALGRRTGSLSPTSERLSPFSDTLAVSSLSAVNEYRRAATGSPARMERRSIGLVWKLIRIGSVPFGQTNRMRSIAPFAHRFVLSHDAQNDGLGFTFMIAMHRPQKSGAPLLPTLILCYTLSHN